MAKSKLDFESALNILKSDIFDNECLYMGAVLFVSKAFNIQKDTLLEELQTCLVYDYTDDEIKAMKNVHCKTKWNELEERAIAKIGLDVYDNGSGLWNEIIVRQALEFEEKYPQIAEGKYDYSLADMVYNYPNAGMLPPIKRIIENKNDVAVFEIGEE